MKIGVFDSGFGGLSILTDIVRTLPHYDYVYLGDNARSPYGDRSHDRIYEFTIQGVEFLFQQDCHLVILACNTASAHALRKIQEEWLPTNYPDRRVLGVIIPVVEALDAIPLPTGEKTKNIGIIGTRATITSGVYGVEVRKRCSDTYLITAQACPLLVPFIEEGWQDTPPALLVLKKYLRPFKNTRTHILILGCTHYGLMGAAITRFMGKRVTILTPGPIVARSLQAYLKRHPEHTSLLSQEKTISFYTTDLSNDVAQKARRFWGHAIQLHPARLE